MKMSHTHSTDNSMPRPTTVDDYISLQPPEIQLRLEQIRQTIRATVPEATERIGYGMPGFYLKRPLVWYAAALPGCWSAWSHLGWQHTAFNRFQEPLLFFLGPPPIF